MTKIVINGFAGESPRQAETLLPNSGAQIATQCNLLRGSLKAFREKNAIAQLINTGTVGTIYKYRKYDNSVFWLEWTQDVDVQPGPIAGDITSRAYFTGTDVPRVFDQTQVNVGAGTTYPKSSFKLGVPSPTFTIAAVAGAGGTGALRDVRYVATYVRKWASGAVDESGPSAASNIVNVKQGQDVDLSGFTGPVATETGITHIWIYRLNSGTADANYEFLKEIAVATATTSETTTDADLGEAISVETWLTPPDDMKGLIMLPNGCAVGFSGNQVCFSVPRQPHTYPLSNRYTLPFTVIGLGYVGTMVVAATTGPSYLLDGTDPQFVGQYKVRATYPCLSKRGLVSAPEGVIYPTFDGLAIVGANGESTLLTEKLVSREEWERFYPSTMIAVSYRNRYWSVYNNTGDTAAIKNAGMLMSHNEPNNGLVEMVGGIHCLYVDNIDGSLYFVQESELDGKNYVYQWDAQAARVAYLWRSKKFILPEDTNFGALRILAKFGDSMTLAEVASYNANRAAIIASNQALLASDDSGSMNGSSMNSVPVNGDDFAAVPPILNNIIGMTFKLFADDVLITTMTVDSDAPVRLPGGYLARYVEIELQGQIEAQEIRMAPSMQEIADAGYPTSAGLTSIPRVEI